MKNAFIAITIFVNLATLTVACNESNTSVDKVSTNTIQHGQANSANSYDRDLIANPHNDTTKCLKPGIIW